MTKWFALLLWMILMMLRVYKYGKSSTTNSTSTNYVSNIFHDLLAFGLYTGRGAPTSISVQHLPHDLQELHDQQQSVGWVQIYYGRLVQGWIAAVHKYHPQTNGVLYYIKCLQLIWQAILKIWHICTSHLHHPSSHEQEDRSVLQAAVHQIFKEARNDPTLSTLIENLDPAQILSRPTHRVGQWVTNSDNHIRAHWQAIQLRTKLCTQAGH